MDGSKRNFFKKHTNNLFKKKGGNRKGKLNISNHYESFENSNPADTLYRIVCPSRKIGGVIGKGGSIIKGLREETCAKITVADSVDGSNERVIVIYSSPDSISHKKDGDEGLAIANEEVLFEPHCAAQDALLRVHSRIVEEDLFGGMASDDDNENNVVTARLLVPNNMVGCLLGKGGDVIQRLRSETGATIRVLPADHLPSCAIATDELVQISGKPEVAKRALYEVSTLLHHNRRKDKPSSFTGPHGQNFHPSGGHMADTLPPRSPMWPWLSEPHSTHPMPWNGGSGNHPSGFRPDGFNGAPPRSGDEHLAEFSMKVLCAAGKIGSVIGKGGSNVKLIQQDTGASIHVEDASAEPDERAIRVSAFEALWNPRSQTIDAILQLQNKTSELSEKGTIVTRLLVPSSKVGCILGQGGHVINEMRRRTRADIRVYSKDEKPECASEDEELVQVCGNYAVAKDALAEIASRLRVRTLRDANSGLESGPIGSVQGLDTPRSLQGRAPPSSVTAGVGGYEPLRGGGYDYPHQNYPTPLPTTGYSYMKLEARISNNGMNSIVGTGGLNFSNTVEVGTGRPMLREPHFSGSDVVEIRGSSEHLNSMQGACQSFMASAGQNVSAHQNSYESNMAAQQSSYQCMNMQENTYQSMNAHQNQYQSVNYQESMYQNSNAQQSLYENLISQQRAYPVITQDGEYINVNTPQGYNIGEQQGAYQYRL